jgi:hypothetical protein
LVSAASEYQVKNSEPGVNVLELLNATPKVVGNPEQTFGEAGVIEMSLAVAKGKTLTVTVKGLPIGELETLTGVTVYKTCKELLVELNKVPEILVSVVPATAPVIPVGMVGVGHEYRVLAGTTSGGVPT